MLRAPHRTRRVERQNLPDDQPVEQHPDRRQVLLHARRRQLPRELLDAGRDHHRLDLRQGNAVVPAPVGEVPHRDQVGAPRIRVSDVGGEEFSEPPPRPIRTGLSPTLETMFSALADGSYEVKEDYFPELKAKGASQPGSP